MGFCSKLVKSAFQENKFNPEDLPKFEAKLFFEGPQRRASLERFTVLLGLSTIIATFGVLSASVATVIGAMIIAPLMTPIMATAAGLVMGDMERAGRSMALVAAGVSGVVGIAWLIGTIHPGIISFNTNSQLASRISPSLADLSVALASGAAGAFAMSRDDIADSLPGVAVSIALVPPLSVVGIALSEGAWLSAWGAMLLFMTNFLSILLAGGGILTLLGLGLAATQELHTRARRQAFVYIAIGILLVAIPLGLTSITVAKESFAEYKTRHLTQEWLSRTDFDIVNIEADGDQIKVIINGDGEPPPLRQLGTDLRSTLNPRVMVRLRVVPSQKLVFPETPVD